MKILYTIIGLTLLVISSIAQDEEGIYKIGTGIGDVTGPAAGVVLNGYVNPITLAAGIHTRLFARSFIVESIDTEKRVVFVSCDLGMFDHGLKLEAIKKLTVIYGDTKYTEKNVQISATHTHSSPSGFMQYYAYLVIESYGFNPLSFWAIVDGIVDSIQMADAALTRGRIYRHKGDLIGYNGNRAENAYSFNPPEEREMYSENVDKEMISLKFVAVDESGKTEPIGSFNWWPVHPISFNDWDNPLVSSDNRGYAAVKFDYEMNKGDGARPGRGKFVSAFAASNLGDVNPRTPGRVNVTEKLEKVAIVGQAQFEKAFELFNDVDNQIQVKGPIDFVQQYVDMPTKKVTIPNPDDPNGGTITKDICKAALGYAFVGLDPGQKDFWDSILHLIPNNTPTPEMAECQKPKVVAIAAGQLTFPHEWAPSIIDLNILRIGTVDIVGVPGEFTTMSGRRLKRKVQELVPADHQIIIAGLANNYINYIATPEEYGELPEQDSAAGATLFGPYTLNAIIESHQYLMEAMNRGESDLVDQGTPPPNLLDKMPPKRDRVDVLPKWPANAQWGMVVTKPPQVMHPGDTLLVRFVTPSLRHNALRNHSHFLIQVQNENNEWADVRTDGDLDTTFWWNAINNIADVYWLKIPNDIPFGTYRVYQSGYYLNEGEDEEPKPYNGATENFQVLDLPQPTQPSSASTLISSSALFMIALKSFVFKCI